jgi:uncharacterized membrane protein
MGGILGLVFALWSMKLLVGIIPPQMPRLRPIQLDASILAVSLLVAVVSGLLFGVGPALRARCMRVSTTLKQSGQATTSTRGQHRYFGGLVVVQVALAMLLSMSISTTSVPLNLKWRL